MTAQLLKVALQIEAQLQKFSAVLTSTESSDPGEWANIELLGRSSAATAVAGAAPRGAEGLWEKLNLMRSQCDSLAVTMESVRRLEMERMMMQVHIYSVMYIPQCSIPRQFAAFRRRAASRRSLETTKRSRLRCLHSTESRA